MPDLERAVRSTICRHGRRRGLPAIIPGLRVLERPGRGPCADALPVAANSNLARGGLLNLLRSLDNQDWRTRATWRIQTVEQPRPCHPQQLRCRIPVLVSISFARVSWCPESRLSLRLTTAVHAPIGPLANSDSDCAKCGKEPPRLPDFGQQASQAPFIVRVFRDGTASAKIRLSQNN